MRFAQLAMNTTVMETATASEVMTEKAINLLATKQTNSLTRQLSDIITTHVTYSDILVDNAVEGTLLLKLTFTNTGGIAAIQVVESPHTLLSNMVLKAIDTVGLDSFENELYYGPEAIIVPISFALK